MQKLSVVIVCKNEVNVIGQTLKSFAGLTDDILVFDNGSTDGTQDAVRKNNVRLEEGSWEGFGKTKNKANKLAKYDWILSLDADEAIDGELKGNLLNLQLEEETKVYQFKFKNFLGSTWLRFGEWGNDKHIRLFNRMFIRWNDADVHESLLLPQNTRIVSIPGYVLHKTAATISEYKNKMTHYAALNASKYFEQGKRSTRLQSFLAASFSFIKNYFFKLGFLDGVTGFECAKINAGYTFLKYKNLRDLKRQSQNRSEQSGKSS